MFGYHFRTCLLQTPSVRLVHQLQMVIISLYILCIHLSGFWCGVLADFTSAFIIVDYIIFALSDNHQNFDTVLIVPSQRPQLPSSSSVPTYHSW
jgi:hypothetical protein